MINEKTREFVYELGKLLNMAKPNLVRCELLEGGFIRSIHDAEWAKYHPSIIDDEEYVVVTCDNGYDYYINVTCDSLAAIGEAVFVAMVGK